MSLGQLLMQREQAEGTFQGQGSGRGTSGYPDSAHRSTNSHFLSMTSSKKHIKDLKRSGTVGFRRGYLEKPITVLWILPLLFCTHSPSSKEKRCKCLPLNSGPRKGLQQSNLERVSYSRVTQTVKNLPAMQETQVWSLGREDPLKKEMTTHSNILAWRSPWTEEPGWLQSMGSQRVRHDWETNTFFHYQCIYPTLWERTAWCPTSPRKLKI